MSGSALITLGLLFLLLLAAGSAAWYAYSRPLPRRKRRRLRPIPKHPVLLAHGLFGFDQVAFAGTKVEYFRDVPKQLRRMGADVHVSRVSPTADVAIRAEQLARQILEIPGKKVNIIAHSMGGIDARYAIAKLGIADKVASLTTIGTPHVGTPLADVGSTLTSGRFGVGKAFGGFGLPLGGIDDATTFKMKRFNKRVRDVEGVHYGSCLATVTGGLRSVSTMLVPTYLYLSGRAGANDGIVPTVSQEWGEVLARIDADHWAQVGWSRRFDAPALYVSLVSELRARGF